MVSGPGGPVGRAARAGQHVGSTGSTSAVQIERAAQESRENPAGLFDFCGLYAMLQVDESTSSRKRPYTAGATGMLHSTIKKMATKISRLTGVVAISFARSALRALFSLSPADVTKGETMNTLRGRLPVGRGKLNAGFPVVSFGNLGHDCVEALSILATVIKAIGQGITLQHPAGRLAIEDKSLPSFPQFRVDTVLRENCHKALAGHTHLLTHSCCSKVVKNERTNIELCPPKANESKRESGQLRRIANKEDEVFYSAELTNDAYQTQPNQPRPRARTPAYA